MVFLPAPVEQAALCTLAELLSCFAFNSDLRHDDNMALTLERLHDQMVIIDLLFICRGNEQNTAVMVEVLTIRVAIELFFRSHHFQIYNQR